MNSSWVTEPMSANGCQKRVVAVLTAMAGDGSDLPGGTGVQRAAFPSAAVDSLSAREGDRHPPVARAALRVVRAVLAGVAGHRGRLAVAAGDQARAGAAEPAAQRRRDRRRPPSREPEVVGVRPL